MPVAVSRAYGKAGVRSDRVASAGERNCDDEASAILALPLAVSLALRAATPVAAQVTTGTIVGTDQRRQRRRARCHHHGTGSEQGDDLELRDRRHRQLHGVLSGAGHLCGRSQRPGLQEVDSRRHHPAGQPAGARRHHAGSGTHRGDDDGGVVGAARARRLLGGRHGHRRAGDQGVAAERPQFRDAGLSVAGHHAWPGGREPVGREHVQPARRVELQRARTSGERQRAGSSTASTTTSTRSTP